MMRLKLLLLIALLGLPAGAATPPATDTGRAMYIVRMEAPGVMAAMQKSRSSGAREFRSSMSGHERRAMLQSEPAARELERVQDQRTSLLREAGTRLGRSLKAAHRYDYLLGGFATELTDAEAARLRALPGVAAVVPSRRYRVQLDATPEYLGAPAVWEGESGPAGRGEGVIIGLIDTGINWAHPFFDELAGDGFRHDNPLGMQLGECSNAMVECNAKLIGVYDFTDEGDGIGRDLAGHGSHVASIAAGNILQGEITLPGDTAGNNLQLSGIAPRANLISYKACFAENPDDPGGGQPAGCDGSAIVDAIDQAMADGVDVLNISLGGTAFFSPWQTVETNLLLDLRAAGALTVVAAGNGGPVAGSVSAPAHAPWVMAAGSVSSPRIVGKRLVSLSGGAGAPPNGVAGAGSNAGFGPAPIVHGSAFGAPLCGAGDPELGPSCNDNAGASNPFPPGTFNGEIVVCDRGSYGRVEKGRNLELAGAGGMILANTDAQAGQVVDDGQDHCLPTIHVTDNDGDALRDWLASGSGHSGRLQAPDRIVENSLGGQLSPFTGRGPNDEVPGVVKPNLVAPGEFIVAAAGAGDGLRILQGTSMAAPHVAGAAAVLASAHPAWSPTQIQSALETAAVWPAPGSSARPEWRGDQRGAGLVDVAAANRAGLYMPVTAGEFRDADPDSSGDPQALNLPGTRLDDCFETCSVVRELRDMQGGGSWQLSTNADFLSVTPATLDLAAGDSATITLEATLPDAASVGEARTGEVLLDAVDPPDGEPLQQRLGTTVAFTGGDLPALWQITPSNTRGQREFSLDGLVALPDATWRASELVRPQLTAGGLSQDPTNRDPFDNLDQVRVVWQSVPADAMQLRVRTLDSPAPDVDLFVGRDLNGDGQPSRSETICESISPNDLEECRLQDPDPGDYWILLQNWTASAPGAADNVRAHYAVLNDTDNDNLMVLGPGRMPAQADFDIELAWDEGRMRQGQIWWGVVGLGAVRENPDNVGQVAVEIRRDADHEPATLPLFDSVSRRLTLAAGDSHERMFIDVPANASDLSVTVEGEDIEAELVRLPFGPGLDQQPLAVPAPDGAVTSGSTGGEGTLDLQVSGGALDAGRWYLVATNTAGAERTLTVTASLSFSGQALDLRRTSYARAQTRQGIDLNRAGSSAGLLWFTYDRQGAPFFYNAAAPAPTGGDRTWDGKLHTLVNDGASQQPLPAGHIAITHLDADTLIYSYDLKGASGSERLSALVNNTCLQRPGGLLNANGVWDFPPSGRGGMSMAVLETTHAYLRYFFDDFGVARWVQANGEGNLLQDPEATVIQVSGNCPLCEPVTPTEQVIGTLTPEFDDNNTGRAEFDFELAPPLQGGLNETDEMEKLSSPTPCR